MVMRAAAFKTIRPDLGQRESFQRHRPLLLDELQGQVDQATPDLPSPAVAAMELVVMPTAHRYQVPRLLRPSPGTPVAQVVNDRILSSFADTALRVRHQVDGPHLDPSRMLPCQFLA